MPGACELSAQRSSSTSGYGLLLILSALQTCRLQKRTLSLESVPRLSSRAELQSGVCHSETVRTRGLTSSVEPQSLQTSQVSVHILWDPEWDPAVQSQMQQAW